MHDAANMALFLICHDLARKQASTVFQFQSIFGASVGHVLHKGSPTHINLAIPHRRRGSGAPSAVVAHVLRNAQAEAAVGTPRFNVLDFWWMRTLSFHNRQGVRMEAQRRP
jgi:hypothetical protein